MKKHSIYCDYDCDELEELLSNYLVDSWSYSKVASFARNEKAFEMNYIYRERSTKSASSVGGNAYHKALEHYFFKYKGGVISTLDELESIAFAYIDKIPANEWKLQKTTPSVEQCIINATKIATCCIKNFLTDIEVYIEDISEVISIELRCDEWLNINGVDVPLPCHAAIDLIVRLKNGKIVIIDHKSKSSFTDDKELTFSGGKQAITYVKCLEAKTDYIVAEVWFIENKYSKNKDGSPQLKKFKLVFDNNTRMLYEVMLYETLKRMIEAVADPDYIYTINDNDKFVDTADLYDFWTRTMLAEVDEFDVLPQTRDAIINRRKKIRNSDIVAVNPKAIVEFRKNTAQFITYDFNNKDMTNSEKIENRLRSLGLLTNVAHEIQGYSSDTYLLEMSAGVKIANAIKYKLDIANALNVSDVRIGNKLTVYEGKSYLSVEISKKRTKDLLFDPNYLEGERLPIGIDNFGRKIVWDLNSHATPHMLICGATGSGKSVSIISTVAYAKLAGITDIIIFDPKYEFCDMASDCIKVYNEIEVIEEQMKLLVEDMQLRAKSGKNYKKTLIVFDEFADAVSSSRSGKALDIKEKVQIGFYAPKKGPLGLMMEPQPKYAMQTVGTLKSLEENLKMLLQKGRSLGFRIVAATQRASVKVITGDAKVNFPVQICFRVPKDIDSKVVIDEAGAEALAGMGDGLIKSPEYLDVVRFQGFYKN